MRRIATILLAVLSLAAAQAAPWRHYTSQTLRYRIAYPANWTIDTHYVFDALGPGKEIHGIAFTIPAGMTTGTNLAGDTKLSVESLPGNNCAPLQFVDPADDVHTVQADGRTYVEATSQDAGVGNRYDTELFVIEGTSPCLAVRYFIHYSAIENFDPGTVKAFDRDRLIAAFDAIRATLRLGK